MTTEDRVTYLKTSEIDREKILLLADASIQAYNALNKKDCAKCHKKNITIPEGYELIDSWTGVDAVFNEFKRVECYGIVLRSQAAPYTYIFAFRGTDGTEDLIDDFGCNYTPFKAYGDTIDVPASVEVESGFDRIYTDSDGKTDSMQHQLFSLVDRYQASDRPIDKLYITGHSLGSALCTLFTLDLALARPEIKAINCNFASPQIGGQAFVDFYEQQTPQHDPETRTIRIQNVYDKVPCVPTEIQGYRYSPYAYLVAFYPSSWKEKFAFFSRIVDNHSIQNYKTVLECAFKSEDGYCQITFDGYDNKKMKSIVPNPADICRF